MGGWVYLPVQEVAFEDPDGGHGGERSEDGVDAWVGGWMDGLNKRRRRRRRWRRKGLTGEEIGHLEDVVQNGGFGGLGHERSKGVDA